MLGIFVNQDNNEDETSATYPSLHNKPTEVLYLW